MKQLLWALLVLPALAFGQATGPYGVFGGPIAAASLPPASKVPANTCAFTTDQGFLCNTGSAWALPPVGTLSPIASGLLGCGASGCPASPGLITLGTGLSFTGNVLNASAPGVLLPNTTFGTSPTNLNFTGIATPFWLGDASASATLTGTVANPTPINTNINSFQNSADSVDTTTTGGGNLNELFVRDVPQTGHTGSRAALWSEMDINGLPTGNAQFYVGGQFTMNVNAALASTGFGNAFGMASTVGVGGTNDPSLAFVTGGEFGVSIFTGSVNDRYGVDVASGGSLNGNWDDAAFIVRGSATALWQNAYQIGCTDCGWPLGATGSVMAAFARTHGGSTSPIALNGIDLSAITFQTGGCAFKSASSANNSGGFCVDPAGRIEPQTTSAHSWTTSGLFDSVPGALSLTDTTSTGTVAVEATVSLGGDTYNSTSATTFTQLATLFVSPPTATGNATCTTCDAIYATGQIITTSDLAASAGIFISGGTVALNRNSAFAVDICDQAGCTATTTIGNSGNTGKTVLAGLAASSAAQTGTVCIGTSNILTYDTTTTCLLSDGRMKMNVLSLDTGLDEIMKLRPVSYDLKPEANPTGLGRQVGLIAQDVIKVDPRLAATYQSGPNKGTPSGVRYEQLTALLTKAVQELNSKVERQQLEIYGLLAWCLGLTGFMVLRRRT